MPPFEKHVFICTKERSPEDPTGCCKAKGSMAIAEYLKGEIKKRGLKDRIRANPSGCLDSCAKGPTVVVYPEGVWYSVPTLEDAREILEEHLLHNRVVKRLQIC